MGIKSKSMGSYASNFLRAVESKSCGLLVLQFTKLSETEREDLRMVLQQAGATHVFVGRMNLLSEQLTKMVSKGKASPNVVNIHKMLKPNGVYVFAPLCAMHWKRIIQATRGLRLFASKDLNITGLFFEHTDIPLDLIDMTPPDYKCTDFGHRRIKGKKGIGSYQEDSAMVEHQKEVSMMIADIFHGSLNCCIYLGVYRNIAAEVSLDDFSSCEELITGFIDQLPDLLRKYFEMAISITEYQKRTVEVWTNIKWQNPFCMPVFPTSHVISLSDVLRKIMLEYVLPVDKIRQIYNEVITLIQTERGGQSVDKWLIKSTLNALMDIEPVQYGEIFEEAFVNSCYPFYLQRLHNINEGFRGVKFVEQLQMMVKDEIDMLLFYTCKHTMQQCLNALGQIILKYVCWDSSDEGKLEYVYGMCKEFLTTDQFMMIRESLCSGVNSALKVIDDELTTDSPIEFVQELLTQKRRFENLLLSCCEMNFGLSHALHCSLRKHLGKHVELPRCISLYIDWKVRTALLSDNDMQDISEVLEFVSYAEDCFSSFASSYQEQMAIRLLFGPYDKEVEHKIIDKLKRHFGSDFVECFLWMMEDMRTSEEKMQTFSENHEGNGLKMNVHVLTTSCWPLSNSDNSTIPIDVKFSSDAFEKFFSSNHQHDISFKYQMDLGSAIVEMELPGGLKYNLHVSTHQMLVLLLFKEDRWISIPEILSATNISEFALWNVLESLSCIPGQNVLIKEPNSLFISEGDLFRFNEEFRNKTQEVQFQTKGCQNGYESETLKQARYIDSIIVKLMMCKKTILCAELFKEVADKLPVNFNLNSGLMETRVNYMLEKNILVRKESAYQLSERGNQTVYSNKTVADGLVCSDKD